MRGPRRIIQPDSCPGQGKLFLGDDDPVPVATVEEQFIAPPYQRNYGNGRRKFPGISPRDGFQDFVSPLVAQGVAEIEIAEKLVRAAIQERHWIGVMLKSMQTGAMKSMGDEQIENVHRLLKMRERLSPLSLAWWYHELDVTGALKLNPSYLEAWSINHGKMRRGLGHFRNTIAQTFAKLQKTTSTQSHAAQPLGNHQGDQ